MKTLIIPDVHMKTKQILPRAKELIKEHNVEHVVFLGDYFDEWKQQTNARLYQITCNDLLKFNEEYDCTFLIGNHDIPYLTGKLHHYSCHLLNIRKEIVQTLQQLKPRLACDVNGWLCSHAGYIGDPSKYHYNNIFSYPNYLRTLIKMDETFNSSPLWIRPDNLTYHENLTHYKKQCVGHTPVYKATFLQTYKGNELVVLDTWSITSTGYNIGDQSFAIIDNDGKLTIVK